MSFGDHLEEFRQRLIHALIGLVVALVVCMVCGKWIFDFLKYPYVQVMTERGESTDLMVLKATGGILTYFRVSLYTALVLAGPWILYHS